MKKKKYRFKKKPNYRGLCYFFLIFAVAVGVFYLLFFFDFFKIREFEIKSQNPILREGIKKIILSELEKKFFNFLPTDSFFLVNSKELENKILKEFLQISEVKCRKKFPQNLILEIKEKQAVALLKKEGLEEIIFLVDENGLIFKKVEQTLEDENLISIFLTAGGEMGKQDLSVIREIDQYLKEVIEIKPKIYSLSQAQLIVETGEDFKIYFDLKTDIKLALTKLRLLLEKEISEEERAKLEYIDLRFSKVFYKYK